MRLVVLLAALGVVLCAPFPDDDSQDHLVAKRSDERMIYGNQQNPAKTAKRSDPSVSELLDQNGKILAEKAQDIKIETQSDDENGDETSEKSPRIPSNIEQELNEVVQEKNQKEEVADTTANESNEENEQISDETDKDESENLDVLTSQAISPEDVEAIAQLENMATGQADDGDDDDNESKQKSESDEEGTSPSEIESNGVQEDDGQGLATDGMEESPYDSYNMYRNYQRLMETYPELRYYNDLPINRRKRAAMRLMSRLRHKRSRRTKRDSRYNDLRSELLDPDQYYLTNNDFNVDPEGYDSLFVPEQEVDPYVELLNEIADREDPVYEMEEPGLGDVQPVIFNGQMGYFVPQKPHNDILSLANEKRKRGSYFFPYSEEPETHFGAFLKQKRSYEDTYERLVNLARMLDAQPNQDIGYEYQ